MKEMKRLRRTQRLFLKFLKNDKTQVRFTHQGLVPEYEYFNVCSDAWGSYINGSLRSLSTTGKRHATRKKEGKGKGLLYHDGPGSVCHLLGPGRCPLPGVPRNRLHASAEPCTATVLV